MSETSELGYLLVRVDEDGEVVESLRPVEDNHIPLLASYADAVAHRGDRDASWWRVAVIRLADDPSTDSSEGGTDGD